MKTLGQLTDIHRAQVTISTHCLTFISRLTTGFGLRVCHVLSQGMGKSIGCCASSALKANKTLATDEQALKPSCRAGTRHAHQYWRRQRQSHT